MTKVVLIRTKQFAHVSLLGVLWCMYVYIYSCMYARLHACTYVQAHNSLILASLVWYGVCMYVYMYSCMYVCTSARIHVCVHMRICVSRRKQKSSRQPYDGSESAPLRRCSETCAIQDSAKLTLVKRRQTASSVL